MASRRGPAAIPPIPATIRRRPTSFGIFSIRRTCSSVADRAGRGVAVGRLQSQSPIAQKQTAIWAETPSNLPGRGVLSSRK